MDWWAMNLPEHLREAQGWAASWWHSDTLRLKHLDDKTQSPRHSQIATIRRKFCWRQLTFTPTDFSSQSLKWAAKEWEGEVRDIISLSLPAAPFTYSKWGANYNPYLKLPLQSAPIDSCPLIYKSLIEKGAADISTSFYEKDMTVCWWYYPLSHSCVSRLSGRQCGGCQRSLLIAVFLFTHQNTEKHLQ